jgi:hypothetical protein
MTIYFDLVSTPIALLDVSELVICSKSKNNSCDEGSSHNNNCNNNAGVKVKNDV